MPTKRKQPPAVIAAAFANPVDQQLVTGFLAGLGYQPVAFSADRAPKADLFILDAPSARRFGEPVLERKRATEIFLPAIIALGQEAPVDPWLAAGFDDSLRLPFTKAELARRVEILLRVRRQSQALAQSAEARYRALFENAPVGIGVADQQGRLLLFNQAMLASGGYTPEDIEQMESVADLYHDPQQRQAALEKFRAEGRLMDFRVQFKRKDGTPYDALLSLTPITFQG
ncbi:MAG: PAS domain S-box protein, partial [Anaerolineae bacterium]